MAVLPVTVAAQDRPRLEVFGGYSYLNADTQGTLGRVSAHGWEVAVTPRINRWLGVEADFSGHYKTQKVVDILGLSTTSRGRDYSFLFGPKFSYHQERKISPFVYGLIGIDRLSGGGFGIDFGSENSLAAALGGGVDVASYKHLAVRVQTDYFLTRHLQFTNDVTRNNFRAAAGLVYRFGMRTTALPASVRTYSVTIRPLGVKGVNLPQGVSVTEVVSGSPADRAGMRAEDVINTIDGKPVKTTEELSAELANRQPGSSMRVGFLVQGKWQTESVLVLGEH